MKIGERFLLCGVVSLCAMVAGCGGALPHGSTVSPDVVTSGSRSSTSKSPISHVVVIVQENRTFNDFFASFPGADGATTAAIAYDSKCHIYKNKTINLRETGLVVHRDYDHYYLAYKTARDGGKMDGFDKIIYHRQDRDACLAPYQYADPTQIQPYWFIAQHYVLAEHMFTTQGSGGFTGHQDLITAGTVVIPSEALVDLPSCSGAACHWGCDAPADTHTSLIVRDDEVRQGAGPFPCSNDFQTKYPTIRDLLDAKGVSWKYYAPASCCNTDGKLFNAFDMIYPVRYGPEWKANISSPPTNVFKDISHDRLPAVSWVIPIPENSDHPGVGIDHGPQWVASLINAIGESAYWNSTTIVVVWDDWGGFYDNLDPVQHAYGGLGFRVPAMIVSAYAKPDHIATTDYQFGSILKYIEQNWNLGYLGMSDANSNSLIDSLDYSQPPATFTAIPSSLGKSYFLKQKGVDWPNLSD